MAKAKKPTKTTATKTKTAKAGSAKKPAKAATVYKGVKVGAKVPQFELTGTSGVNFSDKDFKGKITVLYFYPKDNTPGCTLEGHDFRLRHAKFEKLGAQIFGISRDSLKSHENFKEKCGFPFELLTDDKDTLAKIFDVIQMKQLYGRKFEGIERSTFVVDKDGKLAQEWRKVKVDGHADAVLDYIKNEL